MFKSVGRQVCAFDLEWAPDPVSGRRVYGLPDSLPEAEVFKTMWDRAGATPEKPRPHLKTALCRVIAVAAVIREVQADGSIHLRLTTLPKRGDRPMDEAELLATFLGYLGQHRPQLVGFNSQTTDLPILLQRGLVAGIAAPGFCRSGDRGYGSDYFSRHGEAHIDLKQTLSGWGIATPTLHELAAAMGLPGPLGAELPDVVDWWVAGNIEAIVQQSQYDALSTYLVWLRTAQFAGFFSPEQLQIEEERLRAVVDERIAAGDRHLTQYLARWHRRPPLPAPEATVIPLGAVDQAA